MTDLVVHQQQQQNNIDTNNTTGFITDDKLMIQVPEFSTDQEHTVYYIMYLMNRFIGLFFEDITV